MLIVVRALYKLLKSMELVKKEVEVSGTEESSNSIQREVIGCEVSSNRKSEGDSLPAQEIDREPTEVPKRNQQPQAVVKKNQSTRSSSS